MNDRHRYFVAVLTPDGEILFDDRGHKRSREAFRHGRRRWSKDCKILVYSRKNYAGTAIRELHPLIRRQFTDCVRRKR